MLSFYWALQEGWQNSCDQYYQSVDINGYKNETRKLFGDTDCDAQNTYWGAYI
jgi:hypothetical protein